MDTNVLVLDRNLMPVSTVGLKKGVGYILNHKGYSLVDLPIEMGNSGIFVPSIVVLNRPAAFERMKHFNGKPLKWSKKGVLKRDGNVCGYCLGYGTTVDHITPKAQGGGNTWLNTVAACKSCNSKKGCRTPEEARMPLMYEPHEPNRSTTRITVTQAQREFLIENSMTHILG